MAGLAPDGEPGVGIRRVALHELEALHELDVAVFGEFSYPYFVLRQLFDTSREFLLVAVEPGGRLCGYTLAVLCAEPDPARSSAWLFGLGVRLESRRAGCGRMLTAAILDRLARRGIQTVKLVVEPDNVDAIALYEKFGFAGVEAVEAYFGPGGDRLLMSASLAPSHPAPVRHG